MKYAKRNKFDLSEVDGSPALLAHCLSVALHCICIGYICRVCLDAYQICRLMYIQELLFLKRRFHFFKGYKSDVRDASDNTVSLAGGKVRRVARS